MGREKHWSSDEDMFLARSFVHVSHDAKTGSDKKGKVFWDRVLTQFRTFIKESTRTVVALTGRWKRMQTSVSKFCGHYQTITSVERSGNKEDDYITDAIKLYEAEELEPFVFRFVWEYLRKTVPKFEDILGTPSLLRTKRCRPLDEDQTEAIDLVRGRPEGCKKAKEATLAEKRTVTEDIEKNSIQKAYVAEAKIRNELIADQNRIALFATDSCSLDDMSKKFFDIKRKVEMTKLMKEAESAGICFD